MGKTGDAMGFLEDNNGIDIIDSYYAHRGVEEMATICHTLATKSGWCAGTPTIETYGSKIALIHSEVSEALECLRKSNMDDHLPHRHAIEVELADAMIRIMDLAGYMGLDLAAAIIEKLAYNQQRADHKPEARAAEGGKKI